MRKIIAALATITFLSRAAELCGTCDTWKLGRIVGWSAIGTDEKSAQRLIGQSITIKPTKFEFDGIPCEPATKRTIDRESTLRDDNRLVGNSTLGLPRRVHSIDIGCTEILLRDDNHAVLNWEGALYEAIKKRPAKQPQH